MPTKQAREITYPQMEGTLALASESPVLLQVHPYAAKPPRPSWCRER